ISTYNISRCIQTLNTKIREFKIMKEKVTQGTLVSFRFNSSIVCRNTDVFLPKRFCVVPTNLSSWDMLIICRSK
uniref:Uncharacterized protein n=1 Tax=Ailuropoda melanoleuca TaxID=9646 RepID=A0A7N5K7A0_AILME